MTSARAEECIVAGGPTTFGADMNGTFEVNAGEACQYAFYLSGAVESSKVLTPARHGTGADANVSAFEYRASPGLQGRDSLPSKPQARASAARAARC